MSHNMFHVSIYVKDIPTAVAQYQKMLGVEPAKVKADYAKWGKIVSAAGARID